MSGYCQLPGTEIDGSSLKVEKALDLWTFLSSGLHDFARSISAWRYAERAEAIIFEVDVELPQIRKFPIAAIERLATLFPASDDRTPETLALRDDFPLVPHVNPREVEFPRSLCIYEESFDDLRIRWTSARHIERVRAWLSDSASGRLHRPDQPLEQIFIDQLAPLILPADFSLCGSNGPLYVSILRRENGGLIFVGHRAPVPSQGLILAVTITAPPQTNATVRTVPADLQSLHELLKGFGIDLVTELSGPLMGATEAQRHGPCVVIVTFPLLREHGHEVEKYEQWAFAISDTVEKIGEATGLWLRKGEFVGALIGQKASENALKLLKVILLDPVYLLSRSSAAEFNQTKPCEKRLLAIGVGALGSRVLINCVRAGYGVWTIVDNDFLSPHNPARHELTSARVGQDKAMALKLRANEVFDGAVAGAHCIDVMRPGEKKPELDKLLDECEVICDMSASWAVSRCLASHPAASSRRVSIFLNPAGDSVVLLAEDSGRNVRLDDIEMQYYRYVATTSGLAGHLKQPADRIRVARSCRDVSSRISNENVIICAAVASRLLRQVLEQPSAVAKISRVANSGVNHFDIPLWGVQTVQIGRWQVRTDGQTLASMRGHRTSRLQNETGGVLIGSADFSRNVIYVAQMIPSPADSEEYPTSYVRGTSGLWEGVKEVAEITDGQLQYIGEWHSHADGCSIDPSDDDKTLFAWLTNHLARDGMPPVMCIVGERDERWFVETMG
jgi:hypothetical protein